MKILYIVTHSITVEKKLADQMQFMQRSGLEVSILSRFDGKSNASVPDGVEVHDVPFQREISVLRDVSTLFQTIRLVWTIRPDIVNASTPKAGLIGMIAARLTGVPCRIYVLRGLRHETLAGAKRALLKWMERISCLCASRVVSVSHSLRTTALREGLCGESKVEVLGEGSSNGLNAELFDPGENRDLVRQRTREALTIPLDALVAVFVGRFTKDKGIVELVDAFQTVKQQNENAWLVLVGDYESGDPVPDECKDRIASDTRIRVVPFSPPSDYLVASDVFVFPSFREGFPVAPLEAAAAGLPTVGFACTGTVDAVLDGETGLLVPVGATEQLADAIITYFRDSELRENHALAAKRRVAERFTQEVVWNNLLKLYQREVTAKKGR